MAAAVVPAMIPSSRAGTLRPVPILSAASEEPPLRATGAPLGYFLENAGQVANPEVRFYYTTRGFSAGFERSAVLFSSRAPPNPSEPLDPPRTAAEGFLLRLSFWGSNAVEPRGHEPFAHPSHFFTGDSAAGWRTGVRSYRTVVYDDLYDGVDLVYRVSGGRVKYEFVVRPGADLSRLVLVYEGADGVAVDAEGSLVVHSAGDLRDAPPVAHQDGRPVPCRFAVRGPIEVGFECPSREPSRPLVIDPVISSTFLGGNGDDFPYAFAVDATGYAYIAGTTLSTEFLATPGAFQTAHAPLEDAFVAKLSPNGDAVVYATYLGGGDTDEAFGVAVDASGDVFVTGYTWSGDFPTTAGAFDTALDGWVDVFVTRLNASGDRLVYSTLIGGGDSEMGRAIAVEPGGYAYVTGFTISTGATAFPTTPGAYDRTQNGGFDVFVAKFLPNGTALVFSTLIGGQFDEEGRAIALDTNGNAYVAGDTESLMFPVHPSGFDTVHLGLTEAFVVKVNRLGASLDGGTFLGGDGDETAFSITLATDGTVYLAGATESPDFPLTPTAVDSNLEDRVDGFVAKLDPTLGRLLYSTLLGGDWTDSARGVAVDAAGNAYVVGATLSVNFPTTPGAFDRRLNDTCTFAWECQDAFLVRLNMSGEMPFASYLGGTLGPDFAMGVAVAPDGSVLVVGYTKADDFPLVGVPADSSREGVEAFLARIDTTAFPVTLATIPAGLVVELDGTNVSTPFRFWCARGPPPVVGVPSPQGGNGSRYVFDSWSDGGPMSHAIRCDRRFTLQATFASEHKVLVATRPSSLQVVVDGVSFTAPAQFWWRFGSNHDLAAPSPQSGPPGSRYVWESWSSGGLQAHSVTVASPMQVTANFTTEFHLSLDSPHGSPRCDASDCWYTTGRIARLSVAGLVPEDAGTQHVFVAWTGDVIASVPETTVPMDRPRWATAVWTTQYFLTVISPYGTAQGEGWNDAGTVAIVSVSPVEVRADGAHYRFLGWTGDVDASSASVEVLIDRPKRVTAAWGEVPFMEDNPWVVPLFVGAMALIVSLAFLRLRRRRPPKKGDVPPP